MKPLTFISFICLLISCSNQNPLKGKWKSHEGKTLASMHPINGIPQKTIEALNENFFGKLIVEYKENSFRAQFEDPKDNIESFNEFYDYSLLKETDDYYLVEYYDLLEGKEIQKKFFKDGNCYYVLVTKWDIREYFCRID